MHDAPAPVAGLVARDVHLPGLSRSGRPRLHDAHCRVAAGELVALVGPNGAGKSSLLEVLAGLARPAPGHVTLDGRALSALPHAERARRIGWFEQGHGVEWPLAVETVVALGRLPHRPPGTAPGEADRRAVEAALRTTGTEALRRRAVTTLSGGERVRVLLARVLAGEPELILADEPTAALDLRHQLETMETLRTCADRGRLVVVVLHDLSLAARFCDRVYLLDAGRVVTDGRPEEVFDADRLRETYGVETWCGDEPVPQVLALRVTTPSGDTPLPRPAEDS